MAPPKLIPALRPAIGSRREPSDRIANAGRFAFDT